MRAVFILVAAAVLLGGETWPHPQPAAALVGFSFSPDTSLFAGRDPTQDLALLLDSTQPDLVRLPIYWEDVEPTPDELDFDSIDPLLAVVANHNRAALHPTRVVLTVGARNFLFPELHEPEWAGPRLQPFLDQAQAGDAYRMYFDTSITRYRSSPLLYAWQVENEPLDYVGNDFTGDDQITASQLAWEVGERYTADGVKFVPASVPGSGDTSVKLTIPSACTSGKYGTGTSSSADYSVTLHLMTSAGTFAITAANQHEIVAD